MDYEPDLYWIEVRMMKSSKYHPKPEQVDKYESNEDDLGYVKETYGQVVEELKEAIH